MTDATFFRLVAPLLRVLDAQEPWRRAGQLAEYAERRAEECRREDRLRTWPDPEREGAE